MGGKQRPGARWPLTWAAPPSREPPITGTSRPVCAKRGSDAERRSQRVSKEGTFVALTLTPFFFREGFSLVPKEGVFHGDGRAFSR